MLSILQCLRDVANYVKGTKDYVIDQGVQSGWRYRKWKSGAVELWRDGSTTGNAAVWNGGYGITSLIVNLPFSIYKRNGIIHSTSRKRIWHGWGYYCLVEWFDKTFLLPGDLKTKELCIVYMFLVIGNDIGAKIARNSL